MLPTSTKFLVLALMTCVVVFVETFAGVQPRITLLCGPVDAPFGPQSCSGRTPVLVAGLKAPSTVCEVTVGSTYSRPPWQMGVPPAPLGVQPVGLLAICGIDTTNLAMPGTQVGCSIEPPARIVGSTSILAMIEVEFVAASPFALNSVAKAGSS